MSIQEDYRILQDDAALLRAINRPWRQPTQFRPPLIENYVSHNYNNNNQYRQRVHQS
jgi:hypothetical protein